MEIKYTFSTESIDKRTALWYDGIKRKRRREMTDNFYIEDLLLSVSRETTVERYLPLAACRDELLGLMREEGIVFRDDVTDAAIGKIGDRCGTDTALLFARFIHIYDFKPEKLREIRSYEGTEAYATLAGLLCLPGVRVLRAALYCNSGVSLQTLATHSTEEIQDAVRAYIAREHRSETVPLTKEVNCHRAVAKMILHRNG